PRQIGEWVSSLSGEALSRRFERLRAIEATPLTTTTAVVARTSSAARERDSFHPATEDALTEPEQADISGAQPTASAAPSSPPARKQSWFFWGALGALGLLGGGISFALRASPAANPASAPNATALASPATAAPSVAATTTTVTSSAAPEPI